MQWAGLSMDENASGAFSALHGRKTLSEADFFSSPAAGWANSFYNGFEMWWLAGMPIALVFVLTLLSLSLVSGMSGLGGKLRRSARRSLPAAVARWAATVTGLAVRGSTRSRGAKGQLSAENLKIPHHIAVIMDGNRRYGKSKYGAGVRGHSDGSKTLVAFVDWCIDAGIKVLTVYAFSTENWNRDQTEVDALMSLFNQFMHQIVPEALARDIQVRVLVSDGRKFPAYIVEAIEHIEDKTRHCRAFNLNICVSYGARDEIVGACKRIAGEVARGETSVEQIDERLVSDRLLTAGQPDPDLLIRTSGELRLSNFLLYQAAYSELVFLDKLWPELSQQDLHEVIREFSRRKRRFGK